MSSSASSEVITRLPSRLRNGSILGTEPVARSTWRVSRVRVVPSGRETRTRCGPSSRPGPVTTSIFPFFMSDATAAVSRRAVAKWYGSVAPNTLVVGFDEDAERVLLHQLVATDDPPLCDPWKPR